MEGKDGKPLVFERRFNRASSLEYSKTVSDGTQSDSDLAENTSSSKGIAEDHQGRDAESFSEIRCRF